MASTSGLSLQRLLCDGQPLVAAEASRLLEDDLILGVIGDHGVESLGPVDRRGRADGALQLHDLAALRKDLHEVLALLLAAADVVGADVTQSLDALHGAVDGHNRDAGVDDRLNRRGERLHVLRRDDHTVDSLGDRRLEVGGLGRRVVLTVLHDQFDVELSGLLFGNVHHVDEEGEIEPYAPRRRSEAVRPVGPPLGRRPGAPRLTDQTIESPRADVKLTGVSHR